ncbi:MAG: chorismate synthase [Ruminococcaceae bacterium]|nr:chorismate synthase [Oscillospiraceae bacterium]
MSSELGNNLKITIFGESHGTAIGMTMDGVPAGEAVDAAEIYAFMERRMGGKRFSTARKEADLPHFLSGVRDGVTTGSPICAVIENTNVRSKDYSALENKPRPSHADYPAWVKYGGFADARGGGHFSGRLTAPLCAAGAICKQMLARHGIFVGAHIASVGQIADARYDPVSVTAEELALAGGRAFPVLDEAAGEAMQAEIAAAAAEKDSVGGVVECAIVGLPVGLGEPLYGGVENRLSSAIFGLGAVRGIEFGDGFAAAAMRGSQHNDPYCIENGRVRTKTNRHGGVLGGMTSGMPVVFRVAFKPTPSIAQPQQTVDLAKMEETTITIEGRHDPCIVPRAVPCVEAIAAIIAMDLLLEKK